MNSWIHEYLNTWIQKYLNAWIIDAWILDYLNMRILDTWIFDIGILEHMNAWIHESLNAWILENLKSEEEFENLITGTRSSCKKWTQANSSTHLPNHHKQEDYQTSKNKLDHKTYKSPQARLINHFKILK